MNKRRAGGLLAQAPLVSQLVDAVVDGIVVQNYRGEIVWCNEAAARMLGVPTGELLGRTSLDPRWEAVRADGSALSGDQHPATVALRTGTPQHGVVMGVRMPSGSTCWLEVNCTLLTLPDGPGVASLMCDVTSRFTMQSELRDTLMTLQRGLLPKRAPRLHDLDVAVRYQSAGPTLMVGGDFYGAFPVDEQRHAFFIGDVCGRGVEAASLTSLARHTLFAAGRHVDRPDEVLRWLHEAIMAEDRNVFCTAIFGFVRRDGPRAVVTMSLAGHPQPILLGHDGRKALVGTPGQLLGMLDDWEASVTRLELLEGDQLVLYTDGLIDTPRPRLTDDALLRRVQRGGSADDTADQVLAVAAPPSGCPEDDTALMVMALPTTSAERGAGAH